MRTRRRATVSELREAIERLPRHTRVAMLKGIAANQIIVGAYSNRDGVCPMLAAHRAGGRTSQISFAKAWDAFAFRGSRSHKARRASERELLILRSQLEASLLDDLPCAEPRSQRRIDRPRDRLEDVPAGQDDSLGVPSGKVVRKFLAQLADTPTVDQLSPNIDGTGNVMDSTRTARYDAYKAVRGLVEELRNVKLYDAEAASILWAAEGLLLANSPTDPDAVEARTTFNTLMEGLAANRWQDIGPTTAELQRKRLIKALSECAPVQAVPASA
jgi:hypothetical protein